MTFAVPLALTFLSLGCGGSSSENGAPHANETSETGTTSSVTFTEVYTTIIAPSCTTSQCHNSANMESSNLDMGSQATAYKNLVNVVAAGFLCRTSGDTRVVPGNPSESLFFLKISEQEPPCGFEMPFDLTTGISATPLAPAQQLLVQDWIQGGGLDN